MQALEFWKTVTMDHAYAEPLVSLDLDLVVAIDDLTTLEPLLRHRFKMERFPHRLNLSLPDSDLRVQIQTDPRYLNFPQAGTRSVLGVELPVASLEDVLQGRIWAASDPDRRPTKRKKDLLDIARLIEKYPDLRSRVPAELL